MRLIRHSLTGLLALLLAAPLLAAELSSVRPERVGMSSERLENLDAVLKSYVNNNQVAGQVVLVLREGRIVFSAANGMQDIATGTPMSQGTIFRIASQTKAIISTAIMILHEQGKLDISHPLARYFPEWSDMEVAVPNGNGGYSLEPARRPITLRNLLTHTGGLPYGVEFTANTIAADAWEDAGFFGWYFADREEPIQATIARMGSLPLQEHPGESWIYGYNIDVLGAVVERASGTDLATFLETEIFEPLGMDDTQFYLPQEKASRLASVYRPRAGGGIEAIPHDDGMQSQGMYVDGPRTSYSGGAGLLSTANDYARFLQMTLNGGELDGERILSPKTVELMTMNHLGDIPFRPGEGFGLGFSVVTDLGARGTLGSVGEYGWGGAYHSTYWVDPVENLVVVYLTQIIPATGLDDYAKLRSGIYQAIIE